MQNPTSDENSVFRPGYIHHNPDPDHPLAAVVREAVEKLNPAIPLYEAWSKAGERGLREKYNELFPENQSPSAPDSEPSTNH